MLKLNASPPGPLDAYETGLRQLSTGFSEYWGNVSVVEDQLRSERWETLGGRVESTVQKSQYSGSWQPRPWAAVIPYSTYGAGSDMPWWFVHVDMPCLLPPSARGGAALLEIVEGGQAGPMHSDGLGGPPRAGSRGAGKRRSKREALLARRDTAHGTDKHPDGRFFDDGNGKQLCYSWSRSEGGCTEPYTHGRSNKCEWCRGSHRAVYNDWTTPNRPLNWRPQWRRKQGRRQEVTRRVWSVW